MTEIPSILSTLSEQERMAQRLQQREWAQAAVEQLGKLHGAMELRAAILALLVPAGSRRAQTAWQDETHATHGAAAVFTHVSRLPAQARLPWLETLVLRLRQQPLAARQSTLEATRRVMGARGGVRPLDRLHWLAMRQWLGGSAAAGGRGSAASDLARLPQNEVSAIARFTAFLSRMVPTDAAADSGAPPGTPPPGVVWYDAALALWKPHASIAPCEPPGIDALVQSLHELQALAWMHRPMVVRAWVMAALPLSRRQRLEDGAADALRLSCSLLDSPMPPELARHFDDPPPASRA